MEKDDSLYSLFFLIFILLTYFLSFLRARWKKQKEEQASPPQTQQKKQPVPPPPQKKAPTVKVQQIEPEPSPKKNHSQIDIHYQRASSTPRIQKLVAELPSKGNLILLTEILKPYEPIQ